MELAHLADFYVLRSIIAHEDEMPDLAARARVELEKIGPVMSRCMLDYMFLISFGEARHASRFSGISWYWKQIPYEEGRSGSYHHAIEYDPLKVLPQLAEVFNQSGWTNSYGGKKWAKICTTTHQMWTTPTNPSIVIDHIVDLEHNGGSAFNKPEVKEVIDFQVSNWRQPMNIKEFLNYKMTHDLLALADDIQPRVINKLSFMPGKLFILARRRLGLKTSISMLEPMEYTPCEFGTAELTEKSTPSKTASKKESSKEETKKATYTAPATGDGSQYLSEDELYDPPSETEEVPLPSSDDDHDSDDGDDHNPDDDDDDHEEEEVPQIVVTKSKEQHVEEEEEIKFKEWLYEYTKSK